MKNLKNFKAFEISKSQQMSVKGGMVPAIDCSINGQSVPCGDTDMLRCAMACDKIAGSGCGGCWQLVA